MSEQKKKKVCTCELPPPHQHRGLWLAQRVDRFKPTVLLVVGESDGTAAAAGFRGRGGLRRSADVADQ